jgi:hypothetical protein
VAGAWKSIERFPDGVPDGRWIEPGVDGEVQAASADGVHRWIARRTSRLSFYPTDGEGGRHMLQPATMVDHHVVASADGGATWAAVERRGTAGIAIDARGRVWLAWSGGVDVADARAAIAGEAGAWRTASTVGACCIAVDGGGRVVAGTGGDAWLCRDGERFEKLPGRASERGAWGSFELPAGGFRALRRAPDGAVWGVLGGGLVRLAPDAARWESVNLGLAVLAGKGTRPSQVTVTALAFDEDGAAYCETRSHGKFRRGPSRA